MKTLLIMLLLAAPCMAQTDTLKLSNPTPKPAAKIHTFDTGWWARAHWTSAAFDYSTTGLATKECLDRWPGNHYCGEENPLARPFIGKYPQPWRLSLGFAAESAAVSFIPNKKIRRIVQVGLIASHLILGAKNLKTWH